MTAFADTFACTSRAHCGTCRVDTTWRMNVGAPDACPAGVTFDNLPARPMSSRARGIGDTLEWIFKRLGFKTCIVCTRRRDGLNWRFPYMRLSWRERFRRMFGRRISRKCGGCGKTKTLAPVGAEGV